MIEFDAVESAAVARLGGATELEAALVRPEPPESLAMIGDDRYLSVMCRRIFRAGLTHRLVDARWPAFEAAFDDFDLESVAALDEDDLKRLAADERLIRHRKKIFAVRDNAQAMQTIVDEFGSFGFWLAEWPEDEIVELWAELKKCFTPARRKLRSGLPPHDRQGHLPVDRLGGSGDVGMECIFRKNQYPKRARGYSGIIQYME